jgi:hypothetical protein
MLLNIDRTAGTPLFRQIINAIRSYIDEGSLVAGEALPSTRELAEHLAVNRTTVTQNCRPWGTFRAIPAHTIWWKSGAARCPITRNGRASSTGSGR